jgi:hypothetical protein
VKIILLASNDNNALEWRFGASAFSIRHFEVGNVPDICGVAAV